MINQLKKLYTYRSLLYVFVYRDFKARYRHAALGITWAIIQPLFLMFIFTLVFSHFFKVSTGGIPYPIFSYVALLPWTFLSKTLTTSGNKFIGSRALITKVYFPREIIPLSTVISAIIDFAFGSLVFIFMLFYYKISFTPFMFFIPLILPLQIILALGLALLSSVLMVLFRDLQFAIPLFARLWMYASPIIYSVHNLQKHYKILFYFNPTTGIIESYRDSIIYGRMPDIGYLISSAVVSLLLFIISYWLFKRLEHLLIDIL